MITYSTHGPNRADVSEALHTIDDRHNARSVPRLTTKPKWVTDPKQLDWAVAHCRHFAAKARRLEAENVRLRAELTNKEGK